MTSWLCSATRGTPTPSRQPGQGRSLRGPCSWFRNMYSKGWLWTWMWQVGEISFPFLIFEMKTMMCRSLKWAVVYQKIQINVGYIKKCVVWVADSFYISWGFLTAEGLVLCSLNQFDTQENVLMPCFGKGFLDGYNSPIHLKKINHLTEKGVSLWVWSSDPQQHGLRCFLPSKWQREQCCELWGIWVLLQRKWDIPFLSLLLYLLATTSGKSLPLRFLLLR